MEEQLELIKEKLSKAMEKGQEKKVEKYKKLKKELKQQIKEEKQQQIEEEEEQVEEEQEDSELKILKKKLKKAKKLNIEKKINKYEKMIEKLEKKGLQEEEETDNEQDNEEQQIKSTKQKKKKVKKSEDQQQEEQEEEQEKVEQEQKEEKQEEQIEEDIDFEEKIEELEGKLEELNNEDKKNEVEIQKVELQIKKYKSQLLQQKIDHLDKRIEKLSKKENKEEKIKSLKEKKKGLINERRQLQTEIMESNQQENTKKWTMVDKDSFKYIGNGNTNDDKEGGITIVLFYQYIEPEWTYARYKEALRFTQKIGEELKLGGRLRVAAEGFNGTISGTYHNVRQFTEELKKWEPQNFTNTLFKFIDGNPKGTHFPNLKVFEVKELVNYGLHEGGQPNIKEWGGTHLPPKEYHKQMEQPNSVIIDVRNTYEAIIGNFQPPDLNKCEFIDPGWRRSTELPTWLRSEKTMAQLKDKNVLMYCTGGVRCERASAYIRKELGSHIKNCYQLEGGIEQYMKEFPDGGYWKGKNYTFDKRFAFGAYNKDHKSDEVLSFCSGCKQPWDRYRGKKRCSACLVPILVCKECQEKKIDKKRQLRCTLCEEQNVLPKIKRVPIQTKIQGSQQPQEPAPNPDGVTRLFVGNLPFDSKEETVRSLFRPAKIKDIQWLKDKNTQKFYGSVFIETETPTCAGYCLAVDGRTLKGRQVRVKFEARKKSFSQVDDQE